MAKGHNDRCRAGDAHLRFRREPARQGARQSPRFDSETPAVLGSEYSSCGLRPKAPNPATGSETAQLQDTMAGCSRFCQVLVQFLSSST